MSGSGASNLGYGNITPNSNINGKYVNVDNSNSPATFGSNEIPGLPGLAGAKNNIDAAKGYVPGICLFKGGAKHFKKKINKISRKYKMKGRKTTKSIRRRIKSKYASKSRSRSRSRLRGHGYNLRALAAGMSASCAARFDSSLSAYFSMKTFIVASIACLKLVAGSQSSCDLTRRIEGIRRSESSYLWGRDGAVVSTCMQSLG